MLRGISYTVLLAIISILAVILSSCSLLPEIKDPVFTIRGARIESLGFEKVKLALLCDIENPNPRKLYVDALDYKVLVNKVQVAEDNLRKSVEIAAGQKKTLAIPVTFLVKEVFKSIGEAIANRELNYQFVGSARFGWLTIPFDKSGSINLDPTRNSKEGDEKAALDDADEVETASAQI